jgi:hypothetical protein
MERRVVKTYEQFKEKNVKPINETNTVINDMYKLLEKNIPFKEATDSLREMIKSNPSVKKDPAIQDVLKTWHNKYLANKE